jgi:hypothetical protein
MTFIGGYIVGMAMAFIAVMFFSGVKRANAEYDAQPLASEIPRAPARPTRARRKAGPKVLNSAMSGRATA